MLAVLVFVLYNKVIKQHLGLVMELLWLLSFKFI